MENLDGPLMYIDSMTYKESSTPLLPPTVLLPAVTHLLILIAVFKMRSQTKAPGSQKSKSIGSHHWIV